MNMMRKDGNNDKYWKVVKHDENDENRENPRK